MSPLSSTMMLQNSHIFVKFFTFLKIVRDSKRYNSAMLNSNDFVVDILYYGWNSKYVPKHVQ